MFAANTYHCTYDKHTHACAYPSSPHITVHIISARTRELAPCTAHTCAYAISALMRIRVILLSRLIARSHVHLYKSVTTIMIKNACTMGTMHVPMDCTRRFNASACFINGSTCGERERESARASEGVSGRGKERERRTDGQTDRERARASERASERACQ